MNHGSHPCIRNSTNTASVSRSWCHHDLYVLDTRHQTQFYVHRNRCLSRHRSIKRHLTYSQGKYGFKAHQTTNIDFVLIVALTTFQHTTGDPFQYKNHLSRYKDLHYKGNCRLTFIMGIPTLVSVECHYNEPPPKAASRVIQVLNEYQLRLKSPVSRLFNSPSV